MFYLNTWADVYLPATCPVPAMLPLLPLLLLLPAPAPALSPDRPRLRFRAMLYDLTHSRAGERGGRARQASLYIVWYRIKQNL